MNNYFKLSLYTTVFMFFMEYLNIIFTGIKLYDKDGLNILYKQAILSNAVNLWLFGPIAYYVAINYLSTSNYYYSIISFPGMLLTQNILYYKFHQITHIPNYYWIHKFHHQFNKHTFVLPISANAVSIPEFILLYMLPILTGIYLFKPTEYVIITSSMIISIGNITIHSPILANVKYPNYLVSPKKHINHHIKDIKHNYSAPLFDFDYIVDMLRENKKIK